ncbi:MAG: trypsin-like peptidase domain-containing protein, partial [Planctomycetota bacterium]
GVIVHPSGLIVTNAHVVRRAQQIEVTLADERSFDARVISVQADYDLAVLEIDADKLLPHLPLGRSDDLMVGETVIAIGNPLGYAGSLTTGVVSALDRKLEFDSDLAYEGLIQTDAPINPGNSGGPLLNVRGELIGVNTAIRADAQNIGFAIPADTVAAELVDLLDFEQLNRVMFGATVRHRRLDGAAVTEVTNVAADSPADNRLREGDRIVAVDGQPVRQVCDFLAPMMAVRAGETVHLTVQRGDRRKDVAVQIKARPRPDGKALARKLLGMSVREITPQLARDLRLSLPRGLLVVGIDAGGPADRAGIELKDILFQVNQVYCRDADELGAALDEVTPGEGVRVGIVRGRVAAWAAVRTAGEE